MIEDLKGLMDSAVSSGSVTISVAAADENETLHAVAEASRMGLAKSILVGNQEWIEVILKKLGINTGTFEIIHEKDSVKAAALAVQVVRKGSAEILMKGNVATSKFLQAALGSPGGLKEGLFSDVEVYEDVRSHARLVLVSDGGVNILPSIKQKLEIIRNAVVVAHRLGIRSPKVALLSGSEKVHPDFQSTIDAVALVKMCQDGAVEGCMVDGPFALDNAIDIGSARLKGIESPVAGYADILIMPNLEAGNIFCKGLQYYGNKMLIHVGMGAKIPILIDSRTASAEEKLHSIALAKLMCTCRPDN
ncbi:MAG: phosphate acyltransferase [Deltaproteobacteria bacterium]|nr:phosphate acyltransferase [Deltaproteobacteria bacterium]